ncbi:MAG: glycosyltransferase family 2 protein [Prosthecobacter sp.]
MSISILMPVRNAQDTVAAAIESVRAQTWADWELVIVDDGSEDGTGEILTAFTAQDRRIAVHRLQPRGIAEALMLGCQECRGEFIARMDADDLMAPTRLEQQQAYLLAHPDAGLVSSRVRFGGTEAGYAAHVDWVNSLMTPEAMSLRRFVEAPVAHPSVMFRRELLAQHGGYRAGDFPEDYELWLRWLEAVVRFGKVDAELLTWNDPPQRLSRQDTRYSVEAFYRMKCLYLASWLKENAAAREIWLWGAGRVTRRRFDALETHGVRITGFIDVDESKRGLHRDGRPVRMADDLPDRSKTFLLAGVGARGARENIHQHLVNHGWQEGRDFLLAA